MSHSRTKKRVTVVGTGALVRGNDIYCVSAPGINPTVTLWTPTGPTDQNELWVKLISVTLGAGCVVNVAGGATIEGVASILLADPEGGTYPLGASGGESVHFVFAPSVNAWQILSDQTST